MKYLKMFSRNTFGLFVFSISVFFSDSIFQNSDTLFKNIGVRKLVYPKILTRKETISRFKRWSNGIHEDNDKRSLYIVVNRWTIKTNINDDILISPNYVSQWVHSNKESKPMFNYNKQSLHKCLSLKGSVKEVANSSALLTLCNNDIFGIINVNMKSYFLQPTDINNGHILYETIIPYKLASVMNDYNLYSKKWMKNNNYQEPIVDNIIHNDEKIFNNDGDRCMALVIGNNKTKYTAVESSLCPKNYHKNINKDNIKMREYHKRDRRQSKQYYNEYSYSDTQRPYRETYDCFEQQRNKRALAICDTAEYYNLTRDLASSDYIQYIDVLHETKLDYSYDQGMNARTRDYHDSPQRMENDRQYFDMSSRQRAIYIPQLPIIYRWAKIIVGVDHDVIQFHGRRTEHYVYTVFNIVSTLFKDISSKQILRIVIMKMILYPDIRDSAIYAGDIKYPLYSVNKWNRELWNHVNEKHDMAVWYTHFHVDDEISTSPGPFMCQWQWSCLLIEDVGWLSAITIAHGIGHLIGLTHDGDIAANNNCALASILHTTIMSAIIPAIMPNPIWSSCSKSEYEDVITKYSCLEKPPLNYEHTEFLYGVFSLDDQCRIEFGDGWVFCNRISVHDPCKELWCNRNAGKRRSCMTRQTRTLDGTLCSRGKRCINQTCEDAKRPGYVESTTPKRPQLPPNSDFDTPIYPDHFDYSQTSTYSPTYPGASTPRIPSHPGSNINTPNTYPGPTTYRPPGYPSNDNNSPHNYQGSTTYRPSVYPAIAPNTYPSHPGSSTFRPSGYPGTDHINRPPHYPGASTFGPPDYSASEVNRPPNYPGGTTYRPSGYPVTDTHGTGTTRSPGYSGTDTGTNIPRNYPSDTTLRPSDYSVTEANKSPNYPGATTSGTPGYPGKVRRVFYK